MVLTTDGNDALPPTEFSVDPESHIVAEDEYDVDEFDDFDDDDDDDDDGLSLVNEKYAFGDAVSWCSTVKVSNISDKVAFS
jgi:hypothetical protein